MTSTVPSERALGLAKAILDLVETKAVLTESYDNPNLEESELRELDFHNAVEAFEKVFDEAVEAKANEMNDEYIIIEQSDLLKRPTLVFHGNLAQAGDNFGALHRDDDANPTEAELASFVATKPNWTLFRLA